MSRWQAAQGAALINLIALGGCSLLPSAASKPTDPCPNTIILRPLAQTAVFGSAPERRPDNVAFYGILSEADLKCQYAADALHMNLDVVVAAERGPAAGSGDAVELNYFVAVTGPDQTIISKKPFAVRIAFDTPQKRAGVTDHIEETVPLGGRKATDLTVDVGFQQNPEVVDFYKHFRGR